jgi:hypothetical protein
MIGGLLLAGCAALQRPVETETDMASQFLPTPRDVPHPDSLTHVHLRRSNIGVAVEMDTTFGEIWKRWSSGPQQRQGSNASADFFRVGDFTSFATLQSRELRLAALNRATTLSTYPASEVDSVLHARVERPHAEQVAIDVYLYTYSRWSRLTNLNTVGRVFLKTDAGETYEPARIEYGPMGRQVRDGQSEPFHAVHRRNRIVFERIAEDETDLLESGRLELYVRTSQPRSAFSFEWDLPDSPSLAQQ